MQKLKATIRIDFNTRQPTLFYYDANCQLMCFTLESGHAVASRYYMYEYTAPIALRGYTAENEASIIWRFRKYFLAQADGIELHLKTKISFRDNRGCTV